LKISPVPWATLLVALAAVLSRAGSGWEDGLVLERAVASAQGWRFWTGHLVHVSSGHLGWNIAVFGAAGGWLEMLAPRAVRLYLLWAPPVIGAAIFAVDQEIGRYAGLSGIAAGLVVALALTQLTRREESRPLWAAVLGLVAVKILYETMSGSAVLTEGFRPVPTAHIAGGIAGCILFGFIARRRRSLADLPPVG